ncbi:hypothetical protein WME89_48955 [Sorangium sp. So ce321]|uniref:hypothetical protein n=1 Tax=Sorangium sp. So ce321 TaxID=3133300 RepID=UPI003F601200
MSSRKRRPPTAPRSRRSKAATHPALETPIGDREVDEIRELDRLVPEALSSLSEASRAEAAKTRVRRYITLLANVLRDAADNVEGDARRAYLTMLNITWALLPIPEVAAGGSSAAGKAIKDLERAAMKAMKVAAPDADPLAPSDHHYDPDLRRRYTLTSSKLALLDAVADALDAGEVAESERGSEGRLDLRLLGRELSKLNTIADQTTVRARNVAHRLVIELATRPTYAKLLFSPAGLAHARPNAERLTCAIGWLMEREIATVPNTARVVLYVFGDKKLKNTFSRDLLQTWSEARAARVAGVLDG